MTPLTGLLVLARIRRRSAGNARIGALALPLLQGLFDSLPEFLTATFEIVRFLLELVRQAVWIGLGHDCGIPERDGPRTDAGLSAEL